jgi:hypothetical protein
MENYNAGTVTGDVVAIAKDLKRGYNVSVRVLNVSMRDNETYEEILPVRIDSEDALMKVEEGRKVSLNGVLNTFDVKKDGQDTKSTVLHADPATVEPAADNAPYVNFALMIGEMRDKTCRPALGDKLPWGYCLMQVGGKIFRAAFFRNVLVTMDRSVTRGSIVQHGGPMRYREFETRDKRKGKMLEIISQEDHFFVHKTAEIENPLSAYTPFDPDAKSKKKASKK